MVIQHNYILLRTLFTTTQNIQDDENNSCHKDKSINVANNSNNNRKKKM